MTALTERLTSVTQIRAWAERGRLFAIVDATDEPAVPVKARELGDQRAVSLYKGRAEEELSAIAPYLMKLDWPTLEWITGELWAKPWGILLVADSTLEALRTHFRRFLVVEGPEGESWYFRFYDPRVFARYLPTCTEQELDDFAGPVRAFGVTDLDTYGVKVLTRGEPVPAMPRPQPVVVRR